MAQMGTGLLFQQFARHKCTSDVPVAGRVSLPKPPSHHRSYRNSRALLFVLGFRRHADLQLELGMSHRVPGLLHRRPKAPGQRMIVAKVIAVSYTHLRAHETPEHLVCRLLLEKKKTMHQPCDTCSRQSAV
eukprot:TRINITY_DN51552_c0_g1_i1.p1 TRINITY_DN51552_c0_g1~~TRINITY_DN51552_c0_g1_i1.p1  ORF type:complete len:131 (-),score=19.73 TRINITY_DN51552_c0_g1_i1:8-400(-)